MRARVRDIREAVRRALLEVGLVEKIPFGEDWPEVSYQVYVFRGVDHNGFRPRVIFHAPHKSRPVMDAEGDFGTYEEALEAARNAVRHDKSHVSLRGSLA